LLLVSDEAFHELGRLQWMSITGFHWLVGACCLAKELSGNFHDQVTPAACDILFSNADDEWAVKDGEPRLSRDFVACETELAIELLALTCDFANEK
jgi:hypothetical protein